MKNSKNVLLVAALFLFTFCGPNKKSSLTTTLPKLPANGNTNTPPPPNTNNSVPLSNTPSPAGTPTSAVALNPAHGFPNHRCDIAVGAPLHAPPQTNTATAPKLPAPTLTLPAQGTYAAGTNPPHGQPGHDCSIAVGAPLKKL